MHPSIANHFNFVATTHHLPVAPTSLSLDEFRAKHDWSERMRSTNIMDILIDTLLFKYIDFSYPSFNAALKQVYP